MCVCVRARARAHTHPSASRLNSGTNRPGCQLQTLDTDVLLLLLPFCVIVAVAQGSSTSGILLDLSC